MNTDEARKNRALSDIERMGESGWFTTTFFVAGVAAAQGSKKAFVVAGKARMLESSKRVRPWRQEVAGVAAAHMQERKLSRIEKPKGVGIRLTFVIARPASHLNAKGGLRKGAPVYPVAKPDADKLARAVLDALTGICFGDDSQVVELVVQKLFAVDASDRPGLQVRLESMG